MAVKIRLQRHGKKNQPFYHIVIADARAARDGKFIEKLGTYNPLTSPATVDVDCDRACYWLKNGAQPTDTVRSLFRYKGILYKRHLQIGVEKGAFTEEVAQKRFDEWFENKSKKIESEKSKKEVSEKEARKQLLKAEADVNAKRAEAIAKKKAQAEADAAKPAEEEQPQTEAEAPATEE
ncbi:MAG: 30S ribosomal protein S16 [Bacteroidales bacterium]|nr:30S ribosomal protein S16 [Bacteroidales bacterium]